MARKVTYWGPWEPSDAVCDATWLEKVKAATQGTHVEVPPYLTLAMVDDAIRSLNDGMDRCRPEFCGATIVHGPGSPFIGACSGPLEWVGMRQAMCPPLGCCAFHAIQLRAALDREEDPCDG